MSAPARAVARELRIRYVIVRCVINAISGFVDHDFLDAVCAWPSGLWSPLVDMSVVGFNTRKTRFDGVMRIRLKNPANFPRLSG